jgi:cytoskeletal protein CcmA (bactofilin family)
VSEKAAKINSEVCKIIMIRMGRNSRSENETGTQGGQTASNPSYQYGSSEPQAQSRVVSDSESIARDIKEGRLSGFVGHGTVLTGETNFQMMLRVDGHLTGTVTSDGGTLIIGTNGQVDANVAVAAATINGTVNGDIVATDKIHLGRTAKVVGNIQTPRLILEEGAILEGSCSMQKAREAQEKRENEAKSQYSSSGSGYSYSSTSATEADDDDDDDDILMTSEDEDEESAEAATS